LIANPPSLDLWSRRARNAALRVLQSPANTTLHDLRRHICLLPIKEKIDIEINIPPTCCYYSRRRIQLRILTIKETGQDSYSSQLSTITTYETTTGPPTPPRDSFSPTGLGVLGRYFLPLLKPHFPLASSSRTQSLRRFSTQINFENSNPVSSRISNHFLERQPLPQRVEEKQAKPQTPLKLTKLTISLHKIENYIHILLYLYQYIPSHPTRYLSRRVLTSSLI
jgi:hypothetical protein